MEAGHRTAAREMRKSFIVWLLLASTDAGAVSLYPREVNVDIILFSLYESYEALCIQKGVKLSVEMEEKELPELKADPDRLIQVLRIFMDNAVRFSKKGSGIELQARALKNEICFSVADHGTGISAEDAVHVFERFYCGDKSRTDQSHYGLGLSIAAEITRMMGGEGSVSEKRQAAAARSGLRFPSANQNFFPEARAANSSKGTACE
ncbi:ATP-binding protein [Lachnospiraceae bacterium OF09-33XD]|nr:ATP-binding protein [Lachnospiraceae bacterium OF09-33XD]